MNQNEDARQPRAVAADDTVDTDDENAATLSAGDVATGYSVDELAEQGGVPVRTVRFYIAQGVLPGPGARGKAATYSDEHLVRLRLIRRLAERRVPLTEMRAMLAPISPEDARTLLAEEEQHTATLRQAAQDPSPKEYIAALLSRAQAARQPDGSAGQEAYLKGHEAVEAGRETPISGQPYIAPPPSPGGYVPRPLGPTPPAAPPPRVPEPKSYPRQRTPFPWRGSRPSNDRAPSGESGPESTSAWQRWELAPGVELHVRAESVERYRELIRRLLRTAGLTDR